MLVVLTSNEGVVDLHMACNMFMYCIKKTSRTALSLLQTLIRGRAVTTCTGYNSSSSSNLGNQGPAQGASIMGRAVGEGLRNYYKANIEELEIQARDKQHNLRRLEAQRNELNTRGGL